MPMKNPPHPGLLVRYECIEPLGLTITKAAEGLGVTRQALIVQRLARHSEAFSGFGDRQAEWFDALVPDKQAGVRRVFHGHNSLLMVVDQVHIMGVARFESERDPPVSAP